MRPATEARCRNAHDGQGVAAIATPPSYDGHTMNASTVTAPPADGATDAAIAAPVFEVPRRLSPSRVESFTNCPMAFRFSSVERLPDPPTIATTRGSLVHRALELAYTRPPGQRTPDDFVAATEQAIAEYRELPDLLDLQLDGAQLAQLEADSRKLMERYLRMEEPDAVRPIGLELRLAVDIDGLTLNGVIDRLELRQDDDGTDQLVVTDYKTGRAPSQNWELKSLAGVQFYALLCERLFGQLPAAVRLMYLSTGETIEATPSEQSVRFVVNRTAAVWKAVERACQAGNFQPRQSALCGSCRYQQWCPAFGGDPDKAAIEAPSVLGVARTPAA